MATFQHNIPTDWKRRLTRRAAVGEREIMVFDDLFTKRTQKVLYEFLRKTEFSWNARDSQEYDHSIRWKRNISETAARQLPFFSDVDRLIQDVSAKTPVRVHRIYANFNLYGEVHYPHIDGFNAITALYCANVEWDYRWQGETFFLDGDEPHHVVVPKPGRLIIFDGGITHRGSPPSRDCWEPRMNIVFKFATSPRREASAARHRGRKLHVEPPKVVKLHH